MGPDVAVMDHVTFSFDAKELEMAEENKEGGGEMSLAEISEAIKAFAPLAAQFAEMQKTLSAMGTGGTEAEAGDKDMAAEGQEKEGDKDEAAAAGTGMDERAFVARIAKRDDLAAKISAHVGTFDHKGMTLDDVVAYGMDKLQLAADKGQEASTLAGFLQARPAATPSATVTGMDGVASKGANFVSKHLTPKEG